MARQSSKLTARQVVTARPGRHGDGHGLWLVVAPSGAKKWIFRFSWAGKPNEMGLGGAGVTAVTLAEARGKAALARKLVADGVNPIVAKREAKRSAAGKPTFGKCAGELLAAKSPEWRNARHRQQWHVTLTEYARPLWAMPVDEVDTEAVLGVLQSLWEAIPETASRLRGRIEAVLDAARAKGHIPRNEANPARWKGHLDKLLSKRGKLTRGHHAAMDYRDVPDFIGKLRDNESMTALALEFLILTAARSGETLGARWTEIDFDAKVWATPAGRMKSGREHRVPLSNRALAILERLAAGRTGEFVFTGRWPNKPLSPRMMDALLRRMKVGGATVHGMRSAFRDWASESTMFQREIVEQCLAHAVGDSTERAYRRGDVLEKRRAVMEAWAAYCEPQACAVH